jgi:tetraacyldisaccharide 4'-kinase
VPGGTRHGDAPVLATSFAVTRLVNSQQQTRPLEDLLDRRVGAFCGIGNPDAFRRTLAAIGAPVSTERFRPFPDQPHYTETDLARIGRWGKEQQSDLLLTTRKDLVKIAHLRLGEIPLWAIDIDLTFHDRTDPLLEAFRRTLEVCG